MSLVIPDDNERDPDEHDDLRRLASLGGNIPVEVSTRDLLRLLGAFDALASEGARLRWALTDYFGGVPPIDADGHFVWSDLA